jgi:hypothetical protein
MDLTLRTETFGVDDQSWLGSRHGLNNAVSVTLDTSAFNSAAHYPDGYFMSGLPLGRITATDRYGPYGGTTNEVQQVAISGGPTGGTFTLTFDGQTTAAIAYNATAAAVQSALEALSNIEPGDVTATGGPLPGTAVDVTFGGRYYGQNVPQMTATGALTGGTSPAVTVTTTTEGGSGLTNGQEVLAGFLLSPIKSPADTTVDVAGAMLDHGKVRAARLPIYVDDAGRGDVAGRIIFLEG